MPFMACAHRRDRGHGLEIAAGGLLMLSAPAFAQETVRMSVDSSGNEGDLWSYGASPISADRTIVAFSSLATNLVPNDTNSKLDVFVHDRSTATTDRVSVDALGGEGDGDSLRPSMSSDGRFIAFTSAATNLVPGDTNLTSDIFVRDRSAGTIERVNVDSFGAEADWGSEYPAISSDGRFVAFMSYADNLVTGDANGSSDVFVHDRWSGITERVSVDSSGAEANDASCQFDPPWISADGNLVTFSSRATNLVAGDTNGWTDAFVHDRSTGVTERVSVSASGGEGDGISSRPSISADGRFVEFDSIASNLVPGDGYYNYSDVFVHDRSTGGIERMSVDSAGVLGNGTSNSGMISPDGNYVVFSSAASNLVPGDANGISDIFVHDRSTKTTVLESVDSSGVQANAYSGEPSISDGGVAVAFMSYASNLVAYDSNSVSDIFVHECCGTSATWLNYDVGFPGTNGVPAFTSRQNPTVGSSVTLDLGNSFGQPTSGLLLLGYQRTYLPTNRGGNLLVAPSQVMCVTFSFGGDSFSGAIALDEHLCGMAIDLQAVEFDPGAAKGVSFTAGLELTIGR